MTTVDKLDLEGLHVLDGAMATRLEAKGCDLSGPLWSAHVLESSPEVVAAVHREYLEAGADCLLTASYQISFEGFAQLGRSPADTVHTLRAAVSTAEEVRRAYQFSMPRKVWIASLAGALWRWAAPFSLLYWPNQFAVLMEHSPKQFGAQKMRADIQFHPLDNCPFLFTSTEYG